MSRPTSPATSINSTHSTPDSLDFLDHLDEGEIAQRRAAQWDYLDDVINIESSQSQIGYQRGKVDALKRVTVQGVGLGFEYGHEMGEEIGFYTGLCLSYLTTLLQHTIEGETPTNVEHTNKTDETTPPPPTTTAAHLQPYGLDFSDPALTLDTIKAYNRDYFGPALLDNIHNVTLLRTQLGISPLKYTTTITEFLNLLSLSQSIRFMPGESGDVHLITDLRAKGKALFARLGVSAVFKDESVIDF